MVAVGLGALLVTFDFSVNVALPAITAAFGGDLLAVQWIIIVFQTSIAALMLTWGRAGDVLGHRKVYLLGLASYSLGALICGLAGSLAALVGARAVLGLGAGMILATAPAILAERFPRARRGSAMGWFTASSALGMVVGPVVGGWLVDSIGWRGVFLVRPPVGLLAGALTLLWVWPLPERRGPFDGWGSALLGLSVAITLATVGRSGRWGWHAPQTLGLLALGLGLLALFVAWERRAPVPLLRLGVFCSVPFTCAVAAWALSWVAVFGIWVLVPFYLVEVMKLSTFAAGLLYAASAACTSLASLASGRASDRIGPNLPSLLGLGGVALALLLVATLPGQGSALQATWRLALFGASFGCFQAPNNATVMSGVRPDELGIAAGIVSLSRYYGVVAGVTLATTVASAQQGYYEAVAHLSPRVAAEMALRDSFVLATAVALVALAIAAGGRLAGGARA